MKTLWVIVGAFVALIVLTWVLWSVGASRAFDDAVAEADDAYGINSLPAEYPRRDRSSETAWRLDDLAGQLGLHVIPSVERPRHAADRDAVEGEISDYVSSLRASESDTQPTIPAAIATFLSLHASTLDEIETILLSDAEITFVSRLDEGPSAPLPNLRGHVSLTKVLVTRSTQADAIGESAAAWRALEAAWRLEHTLNEQPWLICRLISIDDLKMIAAAARRLDHPTPEWFSDFASLTPRESVVEGIRSEMYLFTTLREHFSLDDWGYFRSHRAVDLVREPVMRRLFYWDAAYSLRDMGRLIAVAQVTDPCALDFDTTPVERLERPWSASFSIGMPNLGSSFTRANQVALDIEGTAAVLDIKENPEAFDERPSSVCEGESWKVEPLEDGSLRIRFTGHISAPEGQPDGEAVATSHVLPPDSQRATPRRSSITSSSVP